MTDGDFGRRSDRELGSEFDRDSGGGFDHGFDDDSGSEMDHGFDREGRPDRPQSLDYTQRGQGGEAANHDRARAEALRRTVLRKTVRRERARRRGDDSPWAWLGTFGLVGWTVVVPTLLGLAAGIFIDDRVESPISFTITFLIVGAAAGMSMAWYWVRRESESEDR